MRQLYKELENLRGRNVKKQRTMQNYRTRKLET